jgi:hypothetical protein
LSALRGREQKANRSVLWPRQNYRFADDSPAKAVFSARERFTRLQPIKRHPTRRDAPPQPSQEMTTIQIAKDNGELTTYTLSDARGMKVSVSVRSDVRDDRLAKTVLEMLAIPPYPK